jgi:hypothetical protein
VNETPLVVGVILRPVHFLYIIFVAKPIYGLRLIRGCCRFNFDPRGHFVISLHQWNYMNS